MTVIARQERLMAVIKGPHFSEKSTLATEKNNQVVFKVRPDACKGDIQQAVELMFDVKVENVQVVNVKGKSKRFGGVRGRRSDWKKAYVKLAEGNTIDFLGAD